MLFSILWIVWFALLPGTFAVMLATGHDGGTRLWWASSVVLSLAAWINGALHRQNGFGLFAALVAMGMTFGTLADLYGFFAVLRFTEPLPMIILLFALGHICYIAGVLSVAKRLHLTRHPHWSKVLWGTLFIYGLAGAGLWMTLVHPSEHLPSLHLPTALYTLLLSATAAVMAAVAVLKRRLLALGSGGLLFLISDAFLAVRLFQENWRGIGDLCWITYGIGQMLIVYGTVIACWKLEHRIALN